MVTKFASDPRVWKAETLARAAHAGQKRQHGSNDDYIEHPRRVAEAVSRQNKATPEMVAAAWLHDVLEDTCETPEQVSETADKIEDTCGGLVREYVVWLTNVFTKERFPYLNRGQRKKLEALRLSFAPVEVKIIKLCDRLDNLRDMPDPAGDFIRVYVDETFYLVQFLEDDFALAHLARDVKDQAAALLRGLK